MNDIIEQKNNNEENINKIDKKRNRMINIIKKSLQCSKKTQELSSKIMDSILYKNKEKLLSLCEDGLPDELPKLRALVWKINLGYLPLEIEKWDEILKSKRQSYKLYKNFIFDKLEKELELFKGYENMEKSKKLELDKKTHKIILEEICKDTNRTHTEMNFFIKPINKNKIFTEEEIIKICEEKRNCNLKNINDIYKINIELTNSDIISRILFIYSKFEPVISYVQGMNEILSPIYYCFYYGSEDKNESIDDVEADSFYAFYALMSKLKYLFDKNEDQKDNGIRGKIKRLQKMLYIIDCNMFNYLEEINFNYSILVFKWISLLFSQNFEMIDLMRLWDYIFTKDNIFENCYYLSLSILLMKKDQIMNNKITEIYNIILNTNDLYIENIIYNAKYISNKCRKKFLEFMNGK